MSLLLAQVVRIEAGQSEVLKPGTATEKWKGNLAVIVLTVVVAIVYFLRSIRQDSASPCPEGFPHVKCPAGRQYEILILSRAY